MNEKNEQTLKKMYDIFERYDIVDNKSVDDMFVEMMSDYKNFNTLMNIAFSLDTSEFVNESSDITDKRIVYNIKKFGPLYRNIYESYKKCFVNESWGFDYTNKKHVDVYNNFVHWCDDQLKIMKRDELIDMLKTATSQLDHDNLKEIK